MLTTVKHVTYKGFGLRVLSEIPLPELAQVSDEIEEEVDITILKSDMPELWYELSSPKKKLVVLENLVMFQISDIAIFSIQEGKRIVVSPMPGYEEDIVRIYVLGTCMGALLMQRKIFPLHGSAVAINGKAYAFIGDSGAGKSTLASAFLSHGYGLLSDDVIAVSFSEEGYTPLVIPSYPQQKLWQNSLDAFGMETGKYKSIYGRENKYCVPVTSKYFSEPLPLAGIFELVKTDNNMIEIQPIEKLKRFQTLFSHTYRNFLIPPLGLTEWHFNTSVSIVNQINLYQLCRPASGFSAYQLASLILDIVNKEEIKHE